MLKKIVHKGFTIDRPLIYKKDTVKDCVNSQQSNDIAAFYSTQRYSHHFKSSRDTNRQALRHSTLGKSQSLAAVSSFMPANNIIRSSYDFYCSHSKIFHFTL